LPWRGVFAGEQIHLMGGEGVADPRRPEGVQVELSLPSTDRDLRFTVVVVVEARWHGPVPVPVTLPGMAREGITRRAEELARGRTLTESGRLSGELDVALHSWERVSNMAVEARAYCVSIETDPELTAAVAAREEALRRRVVRSWEDEQRAQRTERMSTLLLDPLRATAAWFLDNQDKPDQVVRTAEHFKLLRQSFVPAKLPESPGRLLDDFLATAERSVRLLMFRHLSSTFNHYGQPDLAMRLESMSDETEDG
jgi:hypothetical protein